MLVALQPGLVQPCGEVFDLLRELGPAGGLPDAVFLLAHGRGLGALGRMAQQQLGKGGEHAAS
jgi:hypothetical protein